MHHFPGEAADMRVQRALLPLLLLSLIAHSRAVMLCLQDDIANPIFVHSSGGFVPTEEAVPATCALHCVAVGFTLVGVDEAANCFCTAPAHSRSSDYSSIEQISSSGNSFTENDLSVPYQYLFIGGFLTYFSFWNACFVFCQLEEHADLLY